MIYIVYVYSWMPKIETVHGIQIYVYPKDHAPPHIHAVWPSGRSPEAEAKIEIETGEVIECYGFSESDINQIVKFVKERKEDLKEEWDENQK